MEPQANSALRTTFELTKDQRSGNSFSLKKSCLFCGAPSGEASYCCHACELLDLHQVKSLSLSGDGLSDSPFAYLDIKHFQDLHRHNKSSDYNFVFLAEGLHCSSCVHLLEKLPQFCEGLLDARVNFAQSTVAISLQEGASLGKVAQAIAELGYKPLLLTPQDDPTKKYTQENRMFLMRIAVAGFCAGNTMLFVIPVYAGLAGSWALAFNWISFGLFLPVLLFSAQPFLKGGWNSLKYKTINVDLPISIALISGFSLSTYNLIRGNGAVYFDSTASFMFLILSARYLLKRVQQNYLAPSRMANFFQGEKFLRLLDNQTEIIPWNKISQGHILLLRHNQSLPADAKLISNKATMDMSLFNGESLPRDFSEGMTLFAGTKTLDQNILVETLGTFEDSKMGQMFRQLDQDSFLKSNFITLTDRLAQKLILVVFTIAILFFILYSFVNPSEALNRSLALIVLACPCALAFGSPLTMGMALKKAQRMGILLKSSNSLEKILQIKNVFFDKTGTLTEGTLGLTRTEPGFISPEIQKIILSLESTSYHPVAFALRKAWNLDSATLSVTDSEEILGQGVRGNIAGKNYEIRHFSEKINPQENSELSIELLKNGQRLCKLYFIDKLREDSAKIVAHLKKSGLNCFLVSGDKKSRVLEIAKDCGISIDQSFGELFPEDKAAIVKEHSHTCMIGDGANDALSLQKADVGIAVKGSVDLSLQNADIYFTRGGLSPLLELLNLARLTRKVLIRNLSISLIYNTVGAILALLGFINPMMAAILMPVSSLIIILSSIWGLR
jgi:Cu2+-exporting ATPase/Cu+-exporting ATPase